MKRPSKMALQFLKRPSHAGAEPPLIEGKLFIYNEKKKEKWVEQYCLLYTNRFILCKPEKINKKEFKKNRRKIAKEVEFSVDHYVQKLVNKKILKGRNSGFLLSDFKEKVYISGSDSLTTEYWQKAIGSAISNLQEDEAWWDDEEEPAATLEVTQSRREFAYQERLDAYMKSRGAQPENENAKETELEEEAAVAEIAVSEARNQLNRAAMMSYRIENEELAMLQAEQRKFEAERAAERERVEREEREAEKKIRFQAEQMAQKAAQKAKDEHERKEALKKAKKEGERMRQEEEERQREEAEYRERLLQAEKDRLEHLLKESQKALKKAKEEEQRVAETLKVAEALALEAERKRLIEAKRISVMPMNIDLEAEMRKYEQEKKAVQVDRSSLTSFRNSYSSFVSMGSQLSAGAKSNGSDNRNSVTSKNSRKTRKTKRLPRNGVQSRLAMWQSKIDAHVKGQSNNVFSGGFQERKAPNRSSKSYGQGSSTDQGAKRVQEANKWIEREIQKLVDTIRKIGTHDDFKGGHTVEFGKLFQAYEEISDSLVGIMMRAKKRKRIYYAGDMLFQGIHNRVPVTVLDSFDTIDADI